MPREPINQHMAYYSTNDVLTRKQAGKRHYSDSKPFCAFAKALVNVDFGKILLVDQERGILTVMVIERHNVERETVMSEPPKTYFIRKSGRHWYDQKVMTRTNHVIFPYLELKLC